ncbi:hypothetical protein H8356DRAFT_1346670 [Neocallimastix lanati (nom. inval.)]|nr:hypothetical protein H8356DRAFT_1346670 [Neocallimastix sp. JGI-2020a]
MTDKGKGGQVATKTILNRGNFRLRSQEMKLLLNYHRLRKYITKETFKYVKKPNTKKLKKEISDEQIDSDNETKFYLNNSISEEIKQKGMNVKGKEERIIEIKE